MAATKKALAAKAKRAAEAEAKKLAAIFVADAEEKAVIIDTSTIQAEVMENWGRHKKGDVIQMDKAEFEAVAAKGKDWRSTPLVRKCK